jgi:hypothetical protein
MNRIVAVLQNGCGCGRGLCRNATLALSRLGAQRAQPTGGEPAAWNDELRPAAIKTNPDVGRRAERWMTQCAWAVPKKANFCRDEGKRGRLAFWANHMHLRRPQLT